MKFSNNAVGDKFYTDPELAKKLLDKTFGDLSQFDLIIEPSAGSWAFMRWLPKEKSIAFDLYPDNNETVEQDYLALDLDRTIMERNAINVLIVGNPPYGRMSSLAQKFVKKSCISNKLFGYKTTVAFILSEGFMKKTFASRVPETHSMTYHEAVGSPFFLYGEEKTPYSMLNCGWFVWEPIPRVNESKITSEFIRFHKKEVFMEMNDETKAAIRTQGSGSGQVFYSDFESLNVNTTRFCTGVGTRFLRDIEWNKYTRYNIGAPSLSRQEIMREVNLKFFDNETKRCGK